MKTTFKKVKKFYQKVYLGFCTYVIRDIFVWGFISGGFCPGGFIS